MLFHFYKNMSINYFFHEIAGQARNDKNIYILFVTKHPLYYFNSKI